MELPGEMGALPSLRALALVGNPELKLERVLEVLAPLELWDLRLTLGETAAPLPPAIVGLRRLKRLFLWRRKAAATEVWSLPEALCELTDLEELHVASAGVAHLPANIGQLIRLRVLDLRGNALEDLPDSIVALESLRILRLGMNPIARAAEDENVEASVAEDGVYYGPPIANPGILALRRRMPWVKISID